MVSFLGFGRTLPEEDRDVSPCDEENEGAGAAVHAAGADFPRTRPNNLSLDGWRRLVADGGLTPELLRFVEAQWKDQFGLIQVG